MIAKGKDRVALLIRQIAEENFIPTVEDPPTARAVLAAVEGSICRRPRAPAEDTAPGWKPLSWRAMACTSAGSTEGPTDL